jgi:hypothetical protein
MLLRSSAKSFVRSIITKLLDKLNPLSLRHLAWPITQTVVEELDQLVNGDTFSGNLVENFGWFDS